MKICVKEARRLKSKIEFRRLMEKMKKRFWTSWRSTKSTDIWRSGGGFGKKNLQGLGKALKWKFYYFIGFSAQASTLGVFFDLNKYASGLGSTNLCEGFFGLIFPTKRIFEPTVLLLKKAARCHPFLAVVRCLFHNHLRLKRSSLLNVYLNYKFEFSLLTSHLFCSLFILMLKKFACRTTSIWMRKSLSIK